MLLTFILNLTAAQAAFRMTLLSSVGSKKLAGQDPSTAADGVLISNGNFNYGLKFSVGLSASWHILAGYEASSYAFDNTENILEGDTGISANSTEIGMRWILFSRTALRFLFNLEDSIGFKVNAASRAVLYKENLKYLSLYYDQIVYLGSTIFGGFKVGYDLPTSGSEITDRQGSKYGIFVTVNTSGWGQFETYFELKNITKYDDQLEYIEKDSNLNISYTVGF